MKEILPYIHDGITITKLTHKPGYNIFTIATQNFKVLDLDELTPKRFEQEIERQSIHEAIQEDMRSMTVESEESDSK